MFSKNSIKVNFPSLFFKKLLHTIYIQILDLFMLYKNSKKKIILNIYILIFPLSLTKKTLIPC